MVAIDLSEFKTPTEKDKIENPEYSITYKDNNGKIKTKKI